MGKAFIIRDGRPIFLEGDFISERKPDAVVLSEQAVYGDSSGTQEQPSTFIGGVGTLADLSSSAHHGVSVKPNFPSERLHAARVALQSKSGDASGEIGTLGGWMPGGRMPSGCRPGSDQWKRATEQAEHQAAALEMHRRERERSERFFMHREEQQLIEQAKEANHVREAVFQAARAVDLRCHRSALDHSSSRALYDLAPVAGREGRPSELPPPPEPAKKLGAVGYRPGSAMARKAAGGLYAPAVGTAAHSDRLRHANEERELQLAASAARAVAQQLERKLSEARGMEDVLEQREQQAAVAMRSKEFMGHAERVAARKTINLTINQPLAPAGRLHKPRPQSFERGHTEAVS